MKSTATIDIDRQAPPAVIGQDAARMAPNDADQFLATQIKIIQSDSVLRPVASAPPSRSSASTSRRQPQLPTARVQNAPVVLKNLKVTRPPNTYLLLISYRSPDPGTGRRRRQRHRRQLYPAHLQHPFPRQRRPLRLHGKADG